MGRDYKAVLLKRYFWVCSRVFGSISGFLRYAGFQYSIYGRDNSVRRSHWPRGCNLAGLRGFTGGACQTLRNLINNMDLSGPAGNQIIEGDEEKLSY